MLSELYRKNLRYEMHYRTNIIDAYSTVRNQKERPVFSHLWQCYAWAAILGFINNRRRPLASPVDHAFDMGVIRNNGESIFNALICCAIAKSDVDMNILKSPDIIIKTIEEYANGGFDYISEILIEKDKFYFDSFENFIMELLNRKEYCNE